MWTLEVVRDTKYAEAKDEDDCYQKVAGRASLCQTAVLTCTSTRHVPLVPVPAGKHHVIDALSSAHAVNKAPVISPPMLERSNTQHTLKDQRGSAVVYCPGSRGPSA